VKYARRDLCGGCSVMSIPTAIASILLGNNACRSGNDRSPTLKVFFALHEGEEVPNVL
jgi:hypothetical protein